jgi:hypothetical protein
MAHAVERLRALGWSIGSDGAHLVIEPARDDAPDLTEPQREWLTDHKTALLAHLTRRYPPYPSGPCPTCGGRHYVLPAGTPAWQCSDCHPAPNGASRPSPCRQTWTTVARRKPLQRLVGRGGVALPVRPLPGYDNDSFIFGP